MQAPCFFQVEGGGFRDGRPLRPVSEPGDLAFEISVGDEKIVDPVTQDDRHF
jgi:hypothetical protein